MTLKRFLKYASENARFNVYFDGYYVANIKDGKIQTGNRVDYSDYRIESIYSRIEPQSIICIDLKPPKVKKSCATCLRNGLPITGTRCRTCLTGNLTLWEKGSGL